MNVRILTSFDAAQLRVLRLRGLREHPLDFGADHDEEAAWSVEEWAARMMSTVWFGVEREGKLVACASLRIPDRVRLKHNGWINAMYVVTEAQGAGAGDLLMDAIEAHGRAHGVTILKLYAREINARACAFYRRRGFVSYGAEPDSMIIDGVGYASLEFAKRLGPPAGA